MRGLILVGLALAGGCISISGCVSQARHRREVGKAYEGGFLNAVGQVKPMLEKSSKQVLDLGDENEELRDVNAQLAAKCNFDKMPKARACKAKGLGK